MHISLQFSDDKDATSEDVHRVFKRARDRSVAWITGTEAGQEETRRALKHAADQFRYHLHIAGDVWVAVDRNLVVNGSWEHGWMKAIDASQGTGTHGDRGICWVSFRTTNHLGRITVGASHYLTNGAVPGDPNYRLNTDLTRAIGRWGRAHGAGRGKVFYGGDQNIQDREYDTFRGQPFTSLADELRHWETTGHGNIDVLASYDRDGRVRGKYVRSLDDAQFPLHSDHYLVEGGFRVIPA